MAIQAKGMALSDADFDDLDEFVNFEFVDFFIVWRRFTKYKIFSNEINEDGVDSQYTWAESKKRQS